MKPVQLVLTIAFAIALLSATVFVGGNVGKVSVVPPTPKPVTTELEIPKEGPFGKAVTNKTSFDFGTLEKGGTGSCVFTITNEGEGPLRVKGGKTSCPQCTIGKVSPEDTDIPPGGTAEVEINWKITAHPGKFRQTADVFTTDPQKPKLEFEILGLIDTPVHIVPDGVWSLGDLLDGKPTVAEGLVYSTVIDEFEVDHHESSNSQVTVSIEPASPEAIAAKNARSGYLVKVSVAPDVPVGPLRETVKLHTTARQGVDLEFSVSGQRLGPVSVTGPGWIIQSNLLSLGEFPAAHGRKAKLSMYVRNLDDDLQAEQIEPEKGKVRVNIKKTGKVFGKSKVYDLEVEIPPGAPAIRRNKDAEPVILKLNHPQVSEFKMVVDYYAK